MLSIGRVVLLNERVIRVEEFCALRDDELNTVMLLFLGLNFVGTNVRNLEVIISWSDLT